MPSVKVRSRVSLVVVVHAPPLTSVVHAGDAGALPVVGLRQQARDGHLGGLLPCAPVSTVTAPTVGPVRSMPMKSVEVLDSPEWSCTVRRGDHVPSSMLPLAQSQP